MRASGTNTTSRIAGRERCRCPRCAAAVSALCVATLIARYVAPENPLPGWHSQEQAWATTQGQLAWYRAMEERGELVQIRDERALDAHLGRWESPAPDAPVGYVLSLEGADSIVTLAHLERDVRARVFEPSARPITGPACTRRGRTRPAR